MWSSNIHGWDNKVFTLQAVKMRGGGSTSTKRKNCRHNEVYQARQEKEQALYAQECELCAVDHGLCATNLESKFVRVHGIVGVGGSAITRRLVLRSSASSHWQGRTLGRGAAFKFDVSLWNHALLPINRFGDVPSLVESIFHDLEPLSLL
jgi:hypothetical protein